MPMQITRRAAAGLVLAAPFISRSALGDNSFPPQGSWRTGTPASVGLDASGLQQAQAYAQRYGGVGCVIRYGTLVHSWGSITQLYDIRSATKSITSMLLGFAVDDGKVDLTAPAQRYLPKVGAIPSSNIGNGWPDEIKVEHLATMTAGFPAASDPGAMMFKPGTKYFYSDCSACWLMCLLTQVYGQDQRAYSQERLFAPIGVPSSAAKWGLLTSKYQMPPTGKGSGAMQANVDTMARLGYLYLNNGNWAGQQIISSDYVKLSTSSYYSRIPLPDLKGYGLLWWVATVDGVPHYRMSGINNNHVFVIPSLSIIVVRLGTDGWDNHGGSKADFLRPIQDAVI